MSNSVTVFAADASSIVFATKNGALKTVTAEGALFRGGAALTSLKDAALDSAVSKALNGRYAAAADIIEAAFPSVGKAVRSLLGEPSANKTTMAGLLAGVERAKEPVKGWTKKAIAARSLVRALRQIPAFRVESEETLTIEA